MSGGTDSSVSAMILQERGFEVIGLHISFFDSTWADPQIIEQQETAVSNVEELCKTLSIRYIEINAAKEFYSTVIQYFTQTYADGKTPFPCAVCNPQLKWKILFDQACKQGCDYIATGHYVAIQEYNGILYISQGKDPDKDQSFFLWGLSQEILRKTIFPLADMHKSEVRKYAESKGFISVSKRKDSLGVCFLDNSDYRPFISKEFQKMGIQIKSGNFCDTNGNILGTHKGYPFYTVGQRKNLGIHLNKRLFVKEISATENTVTLSDYAPLYKTEFTINSWYFHSEKDISKQLIVKIRYRKQSNYCRLDINTDTTITVKLLTPLESIAPGQTAVFYDDSRVVGGGFII